MKREQNNNIIEKKSVVKMDYYLSTIAVVFVFFFNET